MKKNSKKHRIKKPLLLGGIFACLLLASSLTVTFASPNLHSMLLDWFEQKNDDSVEQITKAVDEEKRIQMQRLQEKLQSEISEANRQMEAYTDNQINKSRQKIKSHADRLLAEMNDGGDGSTVDKEKIQSQLDQILDNAMKQMQQVKNDSSSGKDNAQKNKTMKETGESQRGTADIKEVLEQESNKEQGNAESKRPKTDHSEEKQPKEDNQQQINEDEQNQRKAAKSEDPQSKGERGK